ncbi:MAG: hypothetical protein B6I20_11070 [Bacteroidetes bacterium 4572_117]|nr:MAG: hypothetical protein B6I20_11070 [Bacteroidetes bacterium 4572_117]
MKIKLLVFSLSILFSVINISAQINYGGKPLSFGNKNLKSIPVFYTPKVNYQQMIQEDEEAGNTKPFRFGKTHKALLNPENSGVWFELPTGERIWRLQIKSENAYAVGLFCEKFNLNKGTKLFIYSTDQSIVKGAFTSLNNKTSGVFSTIPLPGDEIVLELNVPKNVGYGNFEVSGIVHDYKNTFGKSEGSTKASGSCNVNINCPEGDDWQIEKRSVLKYTFIQGSNSYLCTGALINNTRHDATPYLLTANHCISSESVANSAVFIFNYESETCNGTSGSASQTVSSSSLTATPSSGNLDFSLLTLSSTPPIEYSAYFAGWNRGTGPASSTVCIHHPGGDVKKISLDYDPTTTGNYGSGYITNSHWQIHEWDVGTTEGGSSGSPLFDQNHRIVGDLTGGEASCSYNYNDYYAKFDVSWDYYSDAAQQLKAWLDPDNTGAITLDGFDPNIATTNVDVKMQKINIPSGDYCTNNQVVPSVEIKNNGIDDLTNIFISYQINEDNVVYEEWIGDLRSGESETVLLAPVQLPVGNGSFTVFTSMPIGLEDENKSNDTLVTEFKGIANYDIKIVKITDPSGVYCVTDLLAPEIEIENNSVCNITSVFINYQINEGPVISEEWTGNLEFGESVTILLNPIQLPVGEGIFKVFTTMPIGSEDHNKTNDTLVASFQGQKAIENLLINGNKTICMDSKSGSYFTEESGTYSWRVDDGEIVSGGNTDNIVVNWDEWGQRKVHLTITNLCGSYPAETLVVEPSELNLILEISPSNTTTTWLVTNSSGDTISEGTVQASSLKSVISICLNSDSYSFKISSEEACTTCRFQLTNASTNQVVSEGNYSSIQENENIELSPTEGYATFNVYPNPTKTDLNIEANFSGAYENAVFSIYNIKGELVVPKNPLNGRTTINISELRKGYYILKIESDYGEFIRKIIKP